MIDDRILGYLRFYIRTMKQNLPELSKFGQGRYELYRGDSNQLIAKVYFGENLVDEFEPEEICL